MLLRTSPSPPQRLQTHPQALSSVFFSMSSPISDTLFQRPIFFGLLGSPILMLPRESCPAFQALFFHLILWFFLHAIFLGSVFLSSLSFGLYFPPTTLRIYFPSPLRVLEDDHTLHKPQLIAPQSNFGSLWHIQCQTVMMPFSHSISCFSSGPYSTLFITQWFLKWLRLFSPTTPLTCFDIIFPPHLRWQFS